MKVFFDTSIFLALFIEEERDHRRATDKYHKYKEQRALFITSYYILDELFTRLIYDFGKSATQKIINIIRELIEQEELRVLDIDEGTFKKSIEVLLKFSEHKISFTDVTSYVLFKDLKLDEVFTLDSDFKKMRLKTSF